MNKLEAAIQYALWAHHNFGQVLTNVHTSRRGGHEVDALFITGSNRATFYEIKISRSDFLADFKKPRHKMLLNRDEHLEVKPKHFIYVCYGFEPSADEIPEYAGCYCITNNFRLSLPDHYKRPDCVEKAPTLWTQPLTNDNLDFLRKKILHRYMNLQHAAGKELYRQYRRNPGSMKEFLERIKD